MIDDLLNFSRTTRQELCKQSMDMAVVFAEALAVVQESYPERQHEVEWIIPMFPSVCGDHNLLRMVWLNLLDNALKYTRDCARPQIAIQCLEMGDDFQFSIKDNGVGFDMLYADQLFGVFQRLHRQEEFEGTGIGLVTVQRIIARHHGRIWADATLGEGATFFFTLPKFPPKESSS